MSAKAPMHPKRSSRKGRKEPARAPPSRAAISAPLGDFRHTIHVGGAGDAFGDVSFLRGHLRLLPAPSGRPAVSPALRNAVSLPIMAGPPKPPRLHRDGKEKAPGCAGGEDDGGGVAAFPEPFPKSFPEPFPEPFPKSFPEPFPKPFPEPFPEPFQDPFPEPFQDQFPDPWCTGGAGSGSLLSLHVDLGPSILEDVLRVMDKHHGIPT